MAGQKSHPTIRHSQTKKLGRYSVPFSRRHPGSFTQPASSGMFQGGFASGVWLNCVPNNGVSTFMDNDLLRIGLTVCIPHRCKCGMTVDAFGMFPLSCRFNALRIPCHSSIDDVRRSLSAAGMPSMLEPSGLCHGNRKRPDGMTVFPYSRARCLIWDATCINTLHL